MPESQESREELLERIAELEQEVAGLKKTYGDIDLAVDLDSARILRKKYEDMLKANSRFSLRAFANKVKISSGKISDIFNGRYTLSRELAARITENLEFGEPLKQEFLKAVDEENTRLEAYREFAKSNLSRERFYSQRNKQIGDHEDIELIDNWIYYGLLAALGLKECDNTIPWFAKKLQINKALTTNCLEKLVRMGLVEKRNDLYLPLETQTLNNSQAAGTKASTMAANKCSISAFQFLAEKLAADNETNPAPDPANKTICFVAAVDSTKIGNIPEFLGHSMWSSVHDMGEDGNHDQLYMMMMSFRKI